ncbi:MAG TPA: hypothetical protein VMW50_08350 [Dehalococcoidia bacterium]|nr:hypothetical protein [Dehalococcoidia bacterium]
MGLITQAANYRGAPTDWGVNETRNGFPQFCVSLFAQEVWDPEDQQWYAVEGDPEITAYLVLYDSKGQATLNCEQIKKVFGWSGNSFAELNDGQYAETPVQFRVEESVYEGKPQIKVNWIDEYDAVPGRAVKKFDSEGLKNLDKKWSKFLTGGKVQAAKAPAKGKKAIVKSEATVPASTPPEPTVPTETPPAPVTKPPVLATPKKTKAMSKQLAWEYTVEKTEGYDDALRAEEWTRAIGIICPGQDNDKNISPVEWGRIAEATVEAVNKIKF